MDKVFIAIPAYNEEKTIAKVIEDLLQADYKNIIIIDDGSKDETVNIVKKYPVYLCQHQLNCGQGAALRTGTEFALKNKADVIVHFDADGQHQVKDINNFIIKIKEGYDIVIGSRFLGDSYNNIPFTKRYFIHKPAIIFNWFFTGLKMTDAHSGFRALSRKAAKQIRITLNRMAHSTEIPGEVIKNQLKFAEVPIDVIYNDYGQKFSDGFKIIADLLKHKILK